MLSVLSAAGMKEPLCGQTQQSVVAGRLFNVYVRCVMTHIVVLHPPTNQQTNKQPTHTTQVFSMGDIKPNKVADPEARAALVWILGQFGKHLESE